MFLTFKLLEFGLGVREMAIGYVDVTYRMRIPGSWLYRRGIQSHKATIVFVSRMPHETLIERECY